MIGVKIQKNGRFSAVVPKKANYKVCSLSAIRVKDLSYASGLHLQKDPLAFNTYMFIYVQIISLSKIKSNKKIKNLFFF